ncbi:hypothetical protein EON65_56390, partial [archaeon]
MSTKFYFVSFTQFLKLKALGKVLPTLWLPSWRQKDYSSFFLHVSSELSLSPCIDVYVVEISPSTYAEKYVVEELKITSLPVYSLYTNKQLQVLVSYAEFSTIRNVMKNYKGIPDSLTTFPEGVDVVDIIMSEELDEQGGWEESAGGDGGGNVYEGPMRLYVSGSFSSVGKSSICLGIISLLHERYGVSSDRIFYIKPSTQCEKIQSVQRYCEHTHLSCAPLGPLVFYSGFTRSYLKGETENRGQLLKKIEEAMDTLEGGGYY